MRLNELQMLRELRKLLTRPDLTVTKRRLSGKYAHADYFVTVDEPNSQRQVKDIKIYIDPRQDSHITLILHELLHIFVGLNYDIDLKLNDRLEESIVLALESHLFSYLRDPRNMKQLESWDQAIKRKIL